MRIKFILSNILILAIGQICFSSVIDQSKNLENRNFEAISFLGENDIGFSDRYYTNGLKLTYTASGDDFLTSKLQFSLLELITDAHSQRYQTVSLGQAMYVASTITHSNPPLDDHPYAGWLYANFGAHIVTKTSLDSIAFAVGVVGDWSFAEEVQKFHHSNIDVDKPMGWRHQVKNEPTITISYNHSERFFRKSITDDFATDVIVSLGGDVGNAITQAIARTMLRFGWNLPYNYNPARIENTSANDVECLTEKHSNLHCYCYLCPAVRFVAYDISLDGNFFRSYDRGVNSKWLVGEFTAGIATRYNKIYSDLSWTIRSEDYTTQYHPYQIFWGIKIGGYF